MQQFPTAARAQQQPGGVLGTVEVDAAVAEVDAEGALRRLARLMEYNVKSWLWFATIQSRDPRASRMMLPEAVSTSNRGPSPASWRVLPSASTSPGSSLRTLPVVVPRAAQSDRGDAGPSAAAGAEPEPSTGPLRALGASR